jgi:hypothetical protein
LPDAAARKRGPSYKPLEQTAQAPNRSPVPCHFMAQTISVLGHCGLDEKLIEDTLESLRKASAAVVTIV